MERRPPSKDFFNDLMVVLVIYKMEISESPAYQSLMESLQASNQRTSIFIYDNSPEAHTHTHTENWVVTYRHDLSNSGVSKAYNEGFKLAKVHGKSWLLLIDQDTVFEKDFFLKCKIAIDENGDKNIFVPILHDSKGIVSPFYFRFGRGTRLKKINSGQHHLTEKKFINSGLLISCDLFELAGGFDERFQLDFSDLFFLEKLKSVAKFFFVLDTTCTHSLFASGKNLVQETLERFNCYCHAADLFGKQTGNYWVIIWKYAKAVVFCCKYFDRRFLILAFAK